MKRTGKKILGVFMAVLFLVLSGAAAVQAEEPSEVFRIRPDRQEGTRNYFRYQAYEGKEWVSESGEAYIDLGSSDARAQECYYEVSFEGSGIEVFAVKDSKHGKVQYSVDGEHIRTVDLYYSERTQEQSVYKVSGLAEGARIKSCDTEGKVRKRSCKPGGVCGSDTCALYGVDGRYCFGYQYTAYAG